MVEHDEDEHIQRVYIVMEDAGGKNLDDVMEANKDGLPPAEAKDLFKQLLTAVASLHDAKICHRDVKPDNIILKPDPSTPSGFYLTLVDFNVAVDLNETPVIFGATGLKIWSAPETR